MGRRQRGVRACIISITRSMNSDDCPGVSVGCGTPLIGTAATARRAFENQSDGRGIHEALRGARTAAAATASWIPALLVPCERRTSRRVSAICAYRS